MKHNPWSEEELAVKQMAEEVGLVLVKMTTGNQRVKYTRYKLRGNSGFLKLGTIHLEGSNVRTGPDSELLMLDEAREVLERDIRIAEWEPTEEELDEIAEKLPFKEMTDEEREYARHELEYASKDALDVLLRIARAKAEYARTKACN